MRRSSLTSHGSVIQRLENSPIVPETRGTQTDIQVTEGDPEQAHPCPKHVAAIQTTHAGVAFGANGYLGYLVQEPAYQVAKRMTAKRVAAQQENIERQDDRSHANPEMLRTRTITKPHCSPRVMRKDKDE